VPCSTIARPCSSHADWFLLCPIPVAGWSSWNSFKLGINEEVVRSSADIMASELLDAGYEYLLIDDGWPPDSAHYRGKGPARLPDGTIPVSPEKFPSGFKNLTDCRGLTRIMMPSEPQSMFPVTTPPATPNPPYPSVLCPCAVTIGCVLDTDHDVVRTSRDTRSPWLDHPTIVTICTLAPAACVLCDELWAHDTHSSAQLGCTLPPPRRCARERPQDRDLHCCQVGHTSTCVCAVTRCAVTVCAATECCDCVTVSFEDPDTAPGNFSDSHWICGGFTGAVTVL